LESEKESNNLLEEIKRLKDSEAVFKYLFEQSMAPSIIIEDDMTISMANQKAKELFGFGEGKREGYVKWPEFIHVDDIERMKKYHRLRRKNEDLVPREYECKLIDGKGRLQHIFIKLDMIHGTTRSLATFINITSKKLAEKTLQEREKELSAIMDHVKGFIYTVFPNYRIEFANYALIKKAGKDIIGETCYKALFSNNSPCTFCPFKKIFSGKSDKFEFKGLFDERWYKAISSPIKDEAGNTSKLLTIITDIHDIKIEEENLRLSKINLKNEIDKLKSSIKERFRFGRIIGKSTPMQNVYETILKAATSEANIMVYGESGTGKELAAKTIHDLSPRSAKKFVPVNCGAIPENLMESQFFGYVKGAFTGADKTTKGFLEESSGGTLFLDEAGEISKQLQIKLLRAIDEGGFSPVGSTEVIKPDLRIIGATNRNLNSLIENNIIREDFFYRIHVIPIHLPPLRERKEDIPFIAEHFVKELDIKEPILTPEILAILQEHDWPGNIRELKNVILRIATLGPEVISFFENKKYNIPMKNRTLNIPSQNLKTALKKYEKLIIKTALEKNMGHRGKTAANLGITRKTLERRMLEFNLRNK